MTSADPSLADAALDYAAHGWAVFPCHAPAAVGCSCGHLDCASPGKHPRTATGFKAASRDARQVRAWWQRWPLANVGIATGMPSGIVVIDIDPDHGGDRSMRALVQQHETLPKRPTVRSGGDGWHLYFRHPGEPIRSSSGKVGDGIDVRADGGYIIAPPSRHPSGRDYLWRARPTEVPDLPDWLLERLSEPVFESAPTRLTHEPVRIDSAIDAWARAALQGEADRVRTAPKGRRNHTLNRSAFCLGQIVGAGVLDERTVEAVLLRGATNAGLGQREATLTIRSGLRAGQVHPRLPIDRRPIAHDLAR